MAARRTGPRTRPPGRHGPRAARLAPAPGDGVARTARVSDLRVRSRAHARPSRLRPRGPCHSAARGAYGARRRPGERVAGRGASACRDGHDLRGEGRGQAGVDLEHARQTGEAQYAPEERIVGDQSQSALQARTRLRTRHRTPSPLQSMKDTARRSSTRSGHVPAVSASNRAARVGAERRSISPRSSTTVVPATSRTERGGVDLVWFSDMGTANPVGGAGGRAGRPSGARYRGADRTIRRAAARPAGDRGRPAQGHAPRRGTSWIYGAIRAIVFLVELRSRCPGDNR